MEAINHKHMDIVSWLREHGATICDPNIGQQLCSLAHKGALPVALASEA